MKCQNCNFENSEDTLFCKNCGERLTKNDKQNPEQKSNKEKSNTEFVTYPKSEENQGCLTKAWYDIRSTDHWFRKMLLVALCNVVPILEFSSTGYCLRWGADAAKGNFNEMPKGLIENQNIKFGFFEWVIWLAYGFVFFIATSLISATFGKLWLIGIIISISFIAAKYFYDSFVSLGVMKMTIDNTISSSFDLKNIWESYKKDLGSLLCVFFVPSIICCLIAIGLCLIIFAICAWTDLMYLLTFISQAQYTLSSTSSILYAVQVISAVFSCLLLCYIAISFMSGIEKIIRYRAIGVYINRNSKDWIK